MARTTLLTPVRSYTSHNVKSPGCNCILISGLAHPTLNSVSPTLDLSLVSPLSNSMLGFFRSRFAVLLGSPLGRNLARHLVNEVLIRCVVYASNSTSRTLAVDACLRNHRQDRAPNSSDMSQSIAASWLQRARDADACGRANATDQCLEGLVPLDCFCCRTRDRGGRWHTLCGCGRREVALENLSVVVGLLRRWGEMSIQKRVQRRTSENSKAIS
eukprot:COSAG02_NODE_4075_length_5828_cov_9.864200_3_plen_215_part_00